MTVIFALHRYEVKSDQKNSAAQGEILNFPVWASIKAKLELSGPMNWVLPLV